MVLSLRLRWGIQYIQYDYWLLHETSESWGAICIDLVLSCYSHKSTSGLLWEQAAEWQHTRLWRQRPGFNFRHSQLSSLTQVSILRHETTFRKFLLEKNFREVFRCKLLWAYIVWGVYCWSTEHTGALLSWQCQVAALYKCVIIGFRAGAEGAEGAAASLFPSGR